MSVATALTRGRQLAEALMVDTCTIRHRTGETTDENGTIVGTYSTVYTGRCRVQQATPASAPQDTGEAHVYLLRLEVQLPMTVTGLEVGDEIEVTASVHDADLIGRTFLIRDLAHATHKTARRVQCTEQTS